MIETKEGARARAGLRQKLQNRHRRFSALQPKLAWKSWLLITLVLVSIGALFLDRLAIEWVATEPEWLRALAASTTNAGKSGWILVSAAVIGLLVHFGGPRLASRFRRIRVITLVHACFYVFFSVAASGILANVLKRLIGRARPMHLEDLGTFSFQPFANDYAFESFPSGHATTDGALAMALALLFPSLRVPILAVGLALAATRTLIGAHYPSDAISGFAFGVWFALATAILMARHGMLFQKGEQGQLQLRHRRRNRA